jgi:predicted DNA-binding ribbon-helix-helix protein
MSKIIDARTVILKRSIMRNGSKSSVSLEDQFWDGLREIAVREHISVSELVRKIDRSHLNEQNLSSAIRVFVLDHFQKRARENVSLAGPAPLSMPRQ